MALRAGGELSAWLQSPKTPHWWMRAGDSIRRAGLATCSAMSENLRCDGVAPRAHRVSSEVRATPVAVSQRCS